MITDHVDAPPELMQDTDKPSCDCCGVPSSYRRGSIWHGQHLICKACFYIWYDPNWADPTKPASIRKERLKRFGTRDFGREDVIS